MKIGLEIHQRRLRAGEPPALLLGRLNLIRALGAAGVPVIVATPSPDEPTLSSRHCAGRCLLPRLEDRRAAADTLAQAGRQLARALGAPVPLYCGNDDYLDLMEAHRDELAPHFRMLLNEPRIARALIDKDLFGRLAAERGLPVPRSLAWDELRGWRGPVVAKPTTKVDWEHSPVYVRLFGRAGKARVFEDGAQLARNPLAWQLRDELTLQEYIPGDDAEIWSFHGFADEQSRLLASFIGRKIRTYPPHTGVSTYLELAQDERLAALGREVVERTPLKGVFKMDFKRHPGTGEFRLLEINARYNLWHYLGAKNGVNLPKVAYDYLVHGRRPEAAPAYGTRYRWLHLRGDYLAYRSLSAQGRLGLGEWLGSLARTPKVYDLFSWDDPLPALKVAAGRMRRLPRITARLTRWLFTAS